ncbi:MAG: SRPBCC family protein [Acidimicrobiales bacterium]
MTTPSVPHRFELQLEVPGTPEQVWQAVATAQGISAWMMPTEIDAREGGSVVFNMGPDEMSRGRVTAAEVARRLVYEEDWASLVGQPGADVTPLVTEFLIEARSGGTCTVRVVTSAFGTGADWENEFWEEMDRGWAPMLDNLRLYLTHFPGQRATSLWAGSTFATAPEGAIAAVRDALGVRDVGDPVRARSVEGRLERSIDRHFLLRVDGATPGFLNFYSFGAEEGSAVHLQGYLFTDSAPAYVEREQPGWQSWLDGVAAGVAPAPSPAGG